MSLFFRQILILRHYVNYIEEKQDKSSIFLSSSVHTQAGVDIKILSGHSSSNVLLPSGGGIHSKAIGGQRRRANKDEDRGDGYYAEHPIHTTDEDNNVVPNLSRGTQSILARQWWRFHRRQRAPSSGHPHLVVASTLPPAEVAFPQSDGFYYRRQMGSPIIIIIF